jgi:diguanylate cyclase (GGDEF)-like protein/PAS domain S-box-containing protein
MARLPIVNGDDFGLARGVNEGILEAHANDVLTERAGLTWRLSSAGIGHLSIRAPCRAVPRVRSPGTGLDRPTTRFGTAVPRKDDSLNGALLEAAAILEGLPDAVVAAARDGRIVFVNAPAEELFGYPHRELLGKPVQVLWPERLRERYTRNMELYFTTEHPLRFSTEAWGRRRDGSEFVGEMAWGIANTTAGPFLLAIGRDITERLAVEARLRAVAAIGERALAGADPVNLAREAVELLRTRLPVAGALVLRADGSALASTGELTGDVVRLQLGTGDELVVAPERALRDDEMNLARAVANTLGTALSHVRAEERMRYQAVHDPLTGLPNRTLLRDRLDQALARSAREGGATGVLFVDLDHFKQINDRQGHTAGDAVLMKLGSRLQRAVRPADTVARFGGDEFVIVCEDIDETTARALGGRLQDAIAAPLGVAAVGYALTASIGIAVGQADAEGLVSHADVALYRAKARGPGHIEVY